MADKDFKVKQGLDLGTPLPISEGGTGQTSATNAINALLPVQSGQNGKYLTTNGTDTSWASVSVSAATPSTLGTVHGITVATELEEGNVGLGYLALGSNANLSNRNVAIGPKALNQINSNAQGNIAIGSWAGYGITTGNLNTAIGENSLFPATIGSKNVAVGAGAMFLSNSSSYTFQGDNNTFVGTEAGITLGAFASSNVGVGFNALSVYENNNSTGVGTYSLYKNTSGDRNTALGSRSGYEITTGANNTLLGANAGGDTNGLALRSGSNNIIIGHNSLPSAENISNEVTIGNSSITKFRVPGLGIDWTANIEMLTLAGAL